MPKLQELPDGTFKITVPKDIADGKGWGKGDELGFAIVDNKNIFAAPGDILLVWNRPGQKT